MVRTKTPHPKRPAEAAAHRPPRRNSRGLTTLEWLLIVAAVAGLAALAVVLVQNVVDETAEQISGSSARLTAARVAAQEITDATSAEFSKPTTNTNDKKMKVNSDGKEKCDRLRITYGDAFSKESVAAVWQTTANGIQDNNTPRTPGSADAEGCYIKKA